MSLERPKQLKQGKTVKAYFDNVRATSLPITPYDDFMR